MDLGNWPRTLGLERFEEAATILARLWYDRGERNKAGELLAPVDGWFSEGLQTLDLKRTKGLLDELA